MRMEIAHAHHNPTPMLRNLRARALAGLGDCQWILQQNGSYFWGQPVGTTGSYTGCGEPPSAPAPSPSNTAAQNFADVYQAWADNPNLNTPAYLAAEAAAGATPESDQQAAITTLQTYCSQNMINHELFGDSLDTTSCGPGGVPLASAMADVSSVTSPNYPTTRTPVASAPAPAPVPKPTSPSSTSPVGSSESAPAPSGPSSSQAFQTTGSGSDLTGIENWITGSSLISGVPNWALIAGAAAALLFLPKMMGGRK